MNELMDPPVKPGDDLRSHFERKHAKAYFPHKSLDFIIYDKKIKKTLIEASYHPKSILDIGCGSGIILNALNNHEKNILVGIDLSQEALILARQFLPFATFHQGDFLTHQFNQQFDIIVSSMVIEHIENEDLFFQKIKSLCKPNALISITTVFRKKRRFYYVKNDKGEIVLDQTHIREYEDKEKLLYYFRKYKIHIERVSIKPLTYPLIDGVFKITQKAGLEFPRKLAQTSFGHFLRKALPIPIPGYYSFEVLGRVK